MGSEGKPGMKFVAILSLVVCLLGTSTSAWAAGKVSKDVRDDAEYMMRKVVEDIHNYNVRTTVTDITRDKSIEVVAFAIKFIPERIDKKLGEVFSCALVSLKTKMKSGKSAKAQIKRKDEICKGKITGRVKYVANIR
ncbi:MAG: hypothetical protein ACJAYR_001757 [Sneathiella sp.]